MSRSGAEEDMVTAAESAALEWLRLLPLLLCPPSWLTALNHIGAVFLQVCPFDGTVG